ncbi:type 4a pilus biogenesis protein PilO [Patescibacteria group bacterium]|nr:type 4a pilus biogenesis protein PilO [Patescibacteria group bacterium]
MALGWRGAYLRYRDYFLNIVNVYKQKQDVKMFLEILLSAATISIFVVFAIKPTLLTIIDLINQLKSREQTISQMNQKINDIQTAEGLFNANPTTILLVPDAVPTDPSPDTFARQIEGISKKTSAKLLGVSIGDVTLVGKSQEAVKQSDFAPLPEGAKEVSFSVSIEGDYSSLTAFMTNIENLRRPIKIDVFNISSSKTQGGKTLVLVISGRVPYYPN